MLNLEAVYTVATVAILQVLLEDANGRRRDEEGKKPRTPLGYSRLLMEHFGLSHKRPPRDLLARLWTYYNCETAAVR